MTIDARNALADATPDEWVEEFQPLVDKIAAHLLDSAPSFVQRNDRGDLAQEGLLVVLQIARDSAQGKRPWGDSITSYVYSRVHWRLHTAIASEIAKSGANYRRYQSTWRAKGWALPRFETLASPDGVAGASHAAKYAETVDLLASCCTSAIDAAVLQGCQTKPLKEVALELGVHRHTVERTRDAIYERFLYKSQAAETPCAPSKA